MGWTAAVQVGLERGGINKGQGTKYVGARDDRMGQGEVKISRLELALPVLSYLFSWFTVVRPEWIGKVWEKFATGKWYR